MTSTASPRPHDAPPTRGFRPFVALQLQGAFSDNVFKQMLVLYVAAALGPGRAAHQSLLNGLATGLMPVAFLICSCWAGFLADKFSKRAVTLWIKVAESLIMTVGLGVFVWAGAIWTPETAGAAAPRAMAVFYAGLGVFFLMSAQSAFFSPSKYGLIPELVAERRLGWANGVVAMSTNLGIVLGIYAAAELFGWLTPARLYMISIGLVALALVGWRLAAAIAPTPPANPGRSVPFNFLPEFGRYIGILTHNRTLGLTVLGLSWFWGVGAVVAAHLPVWGMNTLGLGVVACGRLYLILALGIGLGSGLAGLISRRRIEVGLIPVGALGLAVGALALGLGRGGLWLNLVALLGLSVSAGLYSTPLNALLQRDAELRDRGGLLAAANMATNASMLVCAGLYVFAASALGLAPQTIFLLIAVATLLGLIGVLYFTPQALLGFMGFVLSRIIYRVRTLGTEHLPTRGPVLLIANHVSYVDALLIYAASPRPVRFIALAEFFDKPVLGRFLRLMRCIPISSAQSPGELRASLEAAGAALAEGDVVCVFAEGQITRTGLMQPLHKGYRIILKRARRGGRAVPVHPIGLDGLWGSVFSFERERFFWKWPRQIPYRARIVFGPALAADAPHARLRQALQEANAEAAQAAHDDLALLDERLIATARRHWRRMAMTDMRTPPLAWGPTLVRAIVLARRLAPVWRDQTTVGILLPPSVGGALVNYAAALSGRTVVNLNYTVAPETMAACARRAGVRSVVTARAFLDKADLAPPEGAVHLEDLMARRPGGFEIAAAWLVARCAPLAGVRRWCRAVRRATPETTASVVFSSGSTGEPKGVVLTQFNIAANIDGFAQAMRFRDDDRMLGVLPFFHSFGYTVTLWASASLPFGVVYHPTPLDTRALGRLCLRHKVTVLVTTPTFLRGFLKRVAPEQMASVRYVVTGAEALPDSLREAFAERFGVEPLQGYGTTECAPVVSVNTDDHRGPGPRQIGHRRGSIGRPLPGVAVRLARMKEDASGPVAPFEDASPGEAGLLLVKGPNVMRGYLEMPEKTAEVLRDGWYDTGDVARIDDDGFIFITGRLSRFSKIGGEMVPHGTVEAHCRAALGLDDDEGLVVTAVPDPAKGEQLVVLHTLDEARLDALGEALTEAGLPNLWIPRRERCFRVETIPILGSGKLDLKAVERLAREQTATDG